MILEKKDVPKIDPDSLPIEFRPLADKAKEIIELRSMYHAAVREISTKLEILDDEFHVKNDYNPIHHMECRVKSIQSTAEKVIRKNLEMNVDGMRAITDIAGVRVICNYTSDIYNIAEMLLRQDDICLIRKKDYIAHPKESGYRSLHLVVTVPVFLSSKTEILPVEIQIRTIAMDTWASLEHELKYKNNGTLTKEESEELRACALAMADVDERMERIHNEVDKGKEHE
ncbi:MAG: GTP pyrophosphokinase [Anaerovoracaceae bacterium]|jgi:putative GTP pyrophosphokinase